MKETGTYDETLIAACGLYCGNCNKYTSGKCAGCKENIKASWCRIRTCCQDSDIVNCSVCNKFSDPSFCKKYNSPVARIIGFVTGTDRAKCIALIREDGNKAYLKLMTEKHWVSIPGKFNKERQP